MSPPGSFLGARFEFLQAQKRMYAASIISNSKAACIADIQRRYFKRFPIEHQHNVDPTPEFLASVDDDEADTEFVAPDSNSMSPEEFKKAEGVFQERQKLVTFRKQALHPFPNLTVAHTSFFPSRQQIERWLQYNHRKGHLTKITQVDPDDPVTILVARLTGTKLAKPRAPPHYNVWAKQPAIKTLVDKEYQLARPQGGRIDCNLLREIRSSHYQKMVPDSEKLHWRKLALEEGKVAVAEWEENLAKPPATDPESRQRCIDEIVAFMEPILDLICAHTGMVAYAEFGGPEPADGGRLNIVSCYSGTTCGIIQQHFGDSEQESHREHIVPAFSRFLRKCYTKAECQARAIPGETSHIKKHQTSDEHSTDHGAINGGDASREASHPGTSALPPCNPSVLHSRHPSVPPSPPRHPSVLPSPPRHLSVPPSPPRRLSMPPSPPRSPSVPPSPPRRLSMPPSPPRNPSVPPSPPRNPSVPPSPPHNPSVQPSPSRNPSIPPSSPRNPSVPPAPRLPLSSTGANVPNLTNSNPKKRKRGDAGNENRQPKRQQVVVPTPSSSTTTVTTAVRSQVPVTLVLPGHAPEWIRQGLKTMQSQDFGQSWRRLVVAWFKYEEKHGFEAKGAKLASNYRPDAIKRWIQLARKNFKPDSRQMKGFETDFWRWWNFLQPSWRSVDSKSTPRTIDGGWNEVDKHGVNGLYTVIGALYLWRLFGAEESLASWTDAVDDACWVLSHLLEGA